MTDFNEEKNALDAAAADAAQQAASAAGDAAQQVEAAAGDAVQQVADAAGDAVQQVADAAQQAGATQPLDAAAQALGDAAQQAGATQPLDELAQQVDAAASDDPLAGAAPFSPGSTQPLDGVAASADAAAAAGDQTSVQPGGPTPPSAYSQQQASGGYVGETAAWQAGHASSQSNYVGQTAAWQAQHAAGNAASAAGVAAAAGAAGQAGPSYNAAGTFNAANNANAFNGAGSNYVPAGAGSYNPPSSTTHKKSSGKTFGIAFAGAAVACALALGGYTAVHAATSSGSDANNSASSSTTVLGSTSSTSTSGSADADTTLAESVSQKCLPSVVAIDVYTSSSSGYYGYGSSGSSDSLTESSLGSGVVLSTDGYIITNYHVIEGSDALKVTIEGTEYDADIIGSDPSSDIAVIKAKDASGLTAIEIGDSDDLTVGEWVMSIGSPFGLEQSVATGIVSATNRSQILSSSSYSSSSSSTTMLYTNMIQTDAAINPGNSGGALVDSDGKLIGINTLITSYSGNYSGVGFAIPANYAVKLAQQIIDGETISHAQLGVSLSTIDSSTAQRYGLSASEGAYVSAVSSGSAAESAGFQKGDIVTSFDGTKITSASDLMIAVRSKNVGDTVTVTVNRDGQSIDLTATLGSDESTSVSSGSNSDSGSQSYQDYLEELLRQYGFGGGSGSGSGNGV